MLQFPFSASRKYSLTLAIVLSKVCLSIRESSSDGNLFWNCTDVPEIIEIRMDTWDEFHFVFNSILYDGKSFEFSGLYHELNYYCGESLSHASSHTFWVITLNENFQVIWLQGRLGHDYQQKLLETSRKHKNFSENPVERSIRIERQVAQFFRIKTNRENGSTCQVKLKFHLYFQPIDVDVVVINFP